MDSFNRDKEKVNNIMNTVDKFETKKAFYKKNPEKVLWFCKLRLSFVNFLVGLWAGSEPW